MSLAASEVEEWSNAVEAPTPSSPHQRKSDELFLVHYKVVEKLLQMTDKADPDPEMFPLCSNTDFEMIVIKMKVQSINHPMGSLDILGHHLWTCDCEPLKKSLSQLPSHGTNGRKAKELRPSSKLQAVIGKGAGFLHDASAESCHPPFSVSQL